MPGDERTLSTAGDRFSKVAANFGVNPKFNEKFGVFHFYFSKVIEENLLEGLRSTPFVKEDKITRSSWITLSEVRKL